MLIVLEIAPEMKDCAARHHIDMRCRRRDIACPSCRRGWRSRRPRSALPASAARLPGSWFRTDVIIGRLNLLPRVAKVRQQIERRIVQFSPPGYPRYSVQNSAPSVHWLNTKRMSKAERSAASILSISRLTEPVPDQAGVVDPRRIAQWAVTDRIGDDLFDLGRAIAEFSQELRD